MPRNCWQILHPKSYLLHRLPETLPATHKSDDFQPVAFGQLLLAASAFWGGQRRAFALATSAGTRLHSRPVYHGAFVALACALRRS